MRCRAFFARSSHEFRNRLPCGRLDKDRFFFVILCAVIALFSGSVYGFGLISPSIQATCQFSTTELEFIYSGGALGQYVTIIPGILFDYWGATTASAYGVILGGMGYGALAFHFYQHRVDHACSSNAAAIGYFSAGQGSAAMFQAGMYSCLRLFSIERHARVSGLLTAGYGLSAAFLSIIVDKLFTFPSGILGMFVSVDLVSYLSFLSFALSSCGLLLLLSLNRLNLSQYDLLTDEIEMKTRTSPRTSHNYSDSADIEFKELASQQYKTRTPEPQVYGSPSTVATLFGSPKFDVESPPSEISSSLSRDTPTVIRQVREASEIPPLPPALPDSQPSLNVCKKGFQKVLYSNTAVEMRSVDYILYAALMICVQGVCASFIGHLTQLNSSLKLNDDHAKLLVMVVSYFGCAGRLGFGCLADLTHHCWSIPFYFVFSAVLLLTSQATLLTTYSFLPGIDPGHRLLMVGACVGVTLGMNFALGPVFVAERFGSGHLGTFQSTMTTGVALASMGFSTIFGHYFDKEANEQHSLLEKLIVFPNKENRPVANPDAAPNVGVPSTPLSCQGVKCFQNSTMLGIESTVFAIACGVLLIMSLRARRF